MKYLGHTGVKNNLKCSWQLSLRIFFFWYYIRLRFELQILCERIQEPYASVSRLPTPFQRYTGLPSLTCIALHPLSCGAFWPLCMWKQEKKRLRDVNTLCLTLLLSWCMLHLSPLWC